MGATAFLPVVASGTGPSWIGCSGLPASVVGLSRLSRSCPGGTACTPLPVGRVVGWVVGLAWARAIGANVDRAIRQTMGRMGRLLFCLILSDVSTDQSELGALSRARRLVIGRPQRL